MTKLSFLKTRKKTIKYANEQELVKIEKQVNKRLSRYEDIYQKTKNKYIKLAQRKKETNKGSVKRILKLSKLMQRYYTKGQKCNEELKLIQDKQYPKHSIIYKIKKRFSEISYNKQKIIWGIIFIAPWIIGFSVLFLPAVLKSFWWSLNDVEPVGTKIVSKFVGFENYVELFQEYVIDGNRIFKVELLLFVQNLALDLPIILIFSLFIAVLLNKEFKGHRLIKAIFFIPVIYNISIISTTLSKGFGIYFENNASGNILLTSQLQAFLMEIGIGVSFFDIVVAAVDRIFMIINFSGIQILIFVAALQSIPNHLYEAAKVEGATKYETFWKITIPMVTPMLLTAAVYTITDSFARAPIYRFLEYATVQSRYGLASSIAVSYFVINLVIIIIVLGLLKGVVFYYDDRKR